MEKMDTNCDLDELNLKNDKNIKKILDQNGTERQSTHFLFPRTTSTHFVSPPLGPFTHWPTSSCWREQRKKMLAHTQNQYLWAVDWELRAPRKTRSVSPLALPLSQLNWFHLIPKLLMKRWESGHFNQGVQVQRLSKEARKSYHGDQQSTLQHQGLE